jgi:hypothetical protein
MDIVCSQCRKPFVQAVRQEGLLDHLLHWIYVHPYRCRVCWRRFYVMQWGFHPAVVPMDAGQYRMRPVQLHGTLLDERGHREGDITDLSISSCMIELTSPLLEGTLLGVHLDALEDEPPIVVEAAIVRSALGARAEVEFLRMAPKEWERLNRFVTSLWMEGTQIARGSGRWKAESLGTS